MKYLKRALAILSVIFVPSAFAAAPVNINSVDHLCAGANEFAFFAATKNNHSSSQPQLEELYASGYVEVCSDTTGPPFSCFVSGVHGAFTCQGYLSAIPVTKSNQQMTGIRSQ